MGAVFLAERADGEFQQKVALKIVRRSFADTDLGAPLPPASGRYSPRSTTRTSRGFWTAASPPTASRFS